VRGDHAQGLRRLRDRATTLIASAAAAFSLTAPTALARGADHRQHQHLGHLVGQRPSRLRPGQKAKAAERQTNADGQIVNEETGKCLDVSDWGTADGTPVILWTCGGGTNQAWTRSVST
jgi:hypothetical protein